MIAIDGARGTPVELLVADDDPGMRSWLYTVLTRAGASVRLAASGWELLALLADTTDVDLVITDLRMPIPSGIDVVAMARAAGVTAPFMLITSFATDQVRRAARSLNTAVLDKPFLIEDLECAIRRVLATAPS